MIYTGYTTNYDLMKEELIQGAELTDYWNFPIMDSFHGTIEKTVSFKESLSKSFTDHESCNLNFFEDDYYYSAIWTNPFKYLNHFKKFKSVCMPDFSKGEMSPLPISLWNNYRNMVLARWMADKGIDVIPCISTLTPPCWDWCFDGFPKHSVYCCCTNGFLKDEGKREVFINGFYEAEKRLEPEFVYIIGRKIVELNPRCGTMYLDSSSMNVRKPKSGMNLHSPNNFKIFV